MSTCIDKTTPSYVDQLLIYHYFKVYLISQGSNIGFMVIINYLRQLIWPLMDSLGHKLLLCIPKLISQVKSFTCYVNCQDIANYTQRCGGHLELRFVFSLCWVDILDLF